MKTLAIRCSVAIVAICLARGVLSAADNSVVNSDKLVVHEWGTFTSLEDETGRQLGGINVDDEPLPAFVHDLNPYVLGSQYTTPLQFKGAPPRHPFVTLRLETPVIYFYPPKSATGPLSVNVDVQFHGGWLTQFYPQATPDAPGLKKNRFDFGPIDGSTTGRLTWSNLQIGTAGQPPKTDEAVWLTPRNVHASVVTMPNELALASSAGDGESEKYLFYRGVGNINSPLAVSTDKNKGTLTIKAADEQTGTILASAPIGDLWLVHIRSGGRTAFRSLKPYRFGKLSNQSLATVQSKFDESDYSTENLVKLQQSMHAALVKTGLFDEEATAMLQTWQKSYFKSNGLRLFYVVPRAWIDHFLPLTISRDAEIQRVMVARTELISPDQRALLKKLSDGPTGSSAWITKIPDSEAGRKFLAGRSEFGELGVAIPPDFQTYLNLGRFRNALVLYEQAREATPALNTFIDGYNLEAFKPPVAKNSP